MPLRTRVARLEQAAGLPATAQDARSAAEARRRADEEERARVLARFPGLETVKAADTDPQTYTRVQMVRGEVAWDFIFVTCGQALFPPAEAAAPADPEADGVLAVRFSRGLCQQLMLEAAGQHPFQLAVAAARERQEESP